MARQPEPIRRSDVIRCEKCGEDYSVTYKRCPFCDERPTRSRSSRSVQPGNGRRIAGSGYNGNRVNPLQIVGLVLSLVLIIAALYIVFNTVGPLLGWGEKEPSTPNNPPTSQSTPGTTNPGGSTSQGEEPPVMTVNSLTLDKSEEDLYAGATLKITATVDPADAEVTWTSSDPTAATVGPDGTVTNINTGSEQQRVIITATAGDQNAQCIVYCRGGSSNPVVGANTTGVVSNASNGLNVRSGPSTSDSIIASLTNGSSVTVLEDAGNNFYHISFIGNGGKATEGYVSKDYITVR